MRSCRRWQLNGLQLVLRGDLSLGMHSKFQYPRRSHVAPETGCPGTPEQTLNSMLFDTKGNGWVPILWGQSKNSDP